MAQEVWPIELRALEARYHVTLEHQEGYLARVEAGRIHEILVFRKEFDRFCLSRACVRPVFYDFDTDFGS